MRLFYLFIIIFFPLILFSQENRIIKMIDGEPIKNGVFLKSTPEGWTFVNKKGVQYYKSFKSVFSINNGMVRVEENLPADQTRGNSKGKTASVSEIYILEIMKQMGDINYYYFPDRYIKVGYFEDNSNKLDYVIELNNHTDAAGFAGSRDGKYAKINKIGDVLTEFKYDHSFRFFTVTKKNKSVKTYVKLDYFTGKEVFSTKDSLVRYWDTKNYIVKNTKTKKYLFTYNSHTYTVPKEFIYIKGLSQKSKIFTYSFYNRKKEIHEYGFIKLNGKKLKTDLEPLSTFYNGHGIVKEEIKDSLQKTKIVIKIVNEQLENFRILNDITVGSDFDSYGNIIMSYPVGEIQNIKFKDCVIDYKGNYIITPAGDWNKIWEVSDGIYHREVYYYKKIDRILNSWTTDEYYYNQKGEKLFQVSNEGLNRPFFFIGEKFNYFRMSSMQNIIMTLDKQNNVLESSISGIVETKL
ncbi:hypothetical protein [Flavobacterium ginsenosidimutans]|uniref:hypothetical protein n=1 Tax=Flavobacterium ginsenosidimutans TaxID=687844 RepID=UPI0013A67C5C|nr:hypothetical protein [Flavobacterium ginsenosidimutans]KAF2328844.1 hypothetical protein DM444_17405 [Flavobacterium ginsenosidimutans]